MKMKLTGILALGLAMALTFGMTVSAAPSTSTDTHTPAPAPEAQSEAQQPSMGFVTGVVANKKLVVGGVEVEVADFKVEAVSNEVVAKAQEQAKVMVAPNATVLKAFDVPAPAGIDYSKGVQITFAVPGIMAGQSIAVLHQKADGTWESLPVNHVGQDSVTATFTSFSPVAIVSYAASPKTGETLPAAALLAVICLAGAALCTKKIGFNK